MFETMKKTYLIPETKVRIPSLTLCQMLDVSDEDATPGGNESKERYEDEDEKGFGHYQW
jgi:hypothetical protein